MSERAATGGHVLFPGDDRLEGILEWPEGPVDLVMVGAETGDVAGGVVIAHPHPLQGGTMAQPVVYRIAQACRRFRLATLRFNFRGVGESLGEYSGTEEYRDVEAAAAFLRGRLATVDRDATPGPGTLPVALAGYSFGSIMAARAAVGAEPVGALALVGLVVSGGDPLSDGIERLASFRGPVLAVCGENDALGYPEDVEQVLTDLEVDFTLSVVEGADHFLEGRQREVGERVASFLAEELAAGCQRAKVGP